MLCSVTINVFLEKLTKGLKLVTEQNIGDQIGTNYS